MNQINMKNDMYAIVSMIIVAICSIIIWYIIGVNSMSIKYHSIYFMPAMALTSMWYFFSNSCKHTWLLGIATVWIYWWPAINSLDQTEKLGPLAEVWETHTAITTVKYAVLMAIIISWVYSKKEYFPLLLEKLKN